MHGGAPGSGTRILDRRYRGHSASRYVKVNRRPLLKMHTVHRDGDRRALSGNSDTIIQRMLAPGS